MFSLGLVQSIHYEIYGMYVPFWMYGAGGH